MEEKSETIDELDNSAEIRDMRKIEAALFISGRWVSLKELVGWSDINPILIGSLIDKLVEKYSDENSALHILSKDNSWKMDVKPEHTDLINRIATGNAEFSKAEQETLAVIAYKQPVKQSVIVKIRGNKSYEHVKNFIELGLLRAKKIGHTKELILSEEFYEYFHIGRKQLKKDSEEEIKEEIKEKIDEIEKEVEREEIVENN